jgi:hypothetical protein
LEAFYAALQPLAFLAAPKSDEGGSL